MECPKCGKDARVTKTTRLKTVDTVRRHLACKHCGHRGYHWYGKKPGLNWRKGLAIASFSKPIVWITDS